VRRFAPDFSEEVTTEVPNFRKRAQQVLHMMIGAGISPEDYIEKLELIQTALMDVYQQGVRYREYALSSRPTLRPKKDTSPGIGIPPMPKGVT